MRGLAANDTTMIVVTHEIGFARDVADRVIFMDGGHVVEQGPPAQLIDTPSSPRLQQFLYRFTLENSRS
jgi:polar amino acid transport system ATP-binding protein